MGKKQQRRIEELRNAQRRQVLQTLRTFEGAKISRRTEHWNVNTAGPNTDLRQAMSLLMRRHQDLVDNNPWASQAISVITGNWIGDGVTGEPEQGTSQKFGKGWLEWCTGTDCDFYGKLNFYGLQDQAARVTAVRGSVLVRQRIAPIGFYNSGKLPPLQLQLMEPDWLDAGRDNGLNIFGGKQYDNLGRVEGYWLHHGHPGDSGYRGIRLTSEFVPAAEIIHHYDCRRPNQYSGVPWGAAALLRLRDLEDFSSAELLKQKISACFAAFVVESEVPELQPRDAEGNPIVAEIIETLEPGAVEILPPGRDIRFAVPPGSGSHREFSRDVLYSVAAAYGITFESLTGILSDVNFSSGRLGWIQFNRNVAKWRWNITIPQLLDPVARWYGEMARLLDYTSKVPSFVWTPPRRELIQPKEEIEYMLEAVRAGFMSLREIQKSFGYVPEVIFEELGLDFAAAKAAGLVLSSNPADDPERLQAEALQSQAKTAAVVAAKPDPKPAPISREEAAATATVDV